MAFDGGQEPSRVMNFSVGCFRRVTRTRTGVRKQVVADICSAWGPGVRAIPPSPTELPSSPLAPSPQSMTHLPSLPSPCQCCCREPGCWIVSRCRRETENESETVFYGLTFSAGGPSTPKVKRGWTQLRCRTCPRHK